MHFGGQVCGPVFAKVVREALVRLHCPEDPVEGAVPDPPATPAADADTVVARVDLEAIEPPMDELLESLDGLELVSSKGSSDTSGPRLPDLTGLTKSAARREMARLGLAWDVRGSGRVVTQDPPAGTPLYDVSLCRLVFTTAKANPS